MSVKQRRNAKVAREKEEELDRASLNAFVDLIIQNIPEAEVYIDRHESPLIKLIKAMINGENQEEQE
jgi:hypothetical protein